MDETGDEHPAPSPSQDIKPDIVITPDVKGVSCRDFHKINKLIEMGRLAAEAVLFQFEELTY